MNKQFTIKPMTIEDYDGLHALWMTIHGFGIRSIDDSAFMSYYQGLYGNGVSGWIREDTHPTGPQPVRELCELHVVEVQKQRIAQHRRGAGKGRICPIRIGQSPLLENEYGFRSVLVEYA